MTVTSAHGTADEGVRRVAELLQGERLAMLTTIAPDGTLVSRPMALQEAEFDGDLWFFTERDARKVGHVQANPQVNVTVGSGSSWVSLTGRARVVQDDARKRDLWNAAVSAWFGDEEPESGEVALLRVEADSAEYWDSPGGRVATLVSFVKSKVSGERFEGGDNERVEM